MSPRVVLAVLCLLASAATLPAQTTPPNPGAGGTPIPAAVEIEVYATALAFYSPPRGQVRWIESTEYRGELIERLGGRFRSWVEGAPGSGGRLRISPIEAAAPGRYRLTVRYRHHTPHFEGAESAQEFLVGCDGAACRILERAPAADGH